MESYKYTFIGNTYNLNFHYSHYHNNGNLYVGLLNLSDEESPYFFDLTINITSLPPFCAAIDNSLDNGICEWLESIGAGKACKRNLRNGFRAFPLFQFDEEFLRNANLDSYSSLFL